MRRGIVFVIVAALAVGACSSGDDDTGSAAGGDGAGAVADGDDADTGTPEDIGATTVATSASGVLTIETTSTRAGLVSAGDVLVTISGGAVGEDVVVTRNGDDVSDAFAPAGDVMRGLVDGLDEGDNEIVATAGDESVALTVTSHPKNGPVFSGPHIEPWVCKTEAAELGPPLDEDCDAPSKTTWSYVSTDGSTKPLADPAALPADVAMTPGDDQVPFVVRVEQGVIDRGIYWIWVLDPSATGGAWDSSTWNERLVYRFGGGCGTSYSQGSPLGAGIDTDLLARGYALATNTLDTFQTACNPVLSAEAALMTREHFVEHYGVPEFTIGDGGSGGAIQQLAIAHNFPGLLDALSPSVAFPDAISIAGGVTDCGLLLEYYTTETGSLLTDEQKTAINGHMTTGTCESWSRLFLGGVNPLDGCDPEIAEQVYDPATNPDGVRCTLQDINVNVLGRDPETGFANRPLDNVGIQYGLDALNDGIIDVDEFLDLNERVGGYDIDGNIVTEREEITEEIAALAYRVGAVIGPGPLQDIPIILRNLFTDPFGDIHTRFHLFSIRDRLQTEGEDDPNLLLWTANAGGGDLVASLTGSIANASEPISVLDEWLTTGARPERAVNRCVLPDGEELSGGWELYDEPGPCADAYPIFGDSRTAAGQSRAGDIVKCQLQPVDPGSYDVELTAEQADRLAAIFAGGVCDWSKPGVGQQAAETTWPDFGRGT